MKAVIGNTGLWVWGLAALVAAGCSGTSDEGATPDGDAENADEATDGEEPSDGDDEPAFTHQVYTHTIDAEQNGIATGDYAAPAFVYDELAVDPRYTHALSFMTTPMLPPRLSAVPSPGPLVLYSDALDVLVFSPMDHFFESLILFENGKIRYGLQGELDAVPAGFTQRFLRVEGQGVAATLEHWGDLLLADRNRARRDRYADTGLSHLGYWTDNGAYYYYETEEGMNEAETMLAVAEDARRRGIPYGYLQLDSWWYFKANMGGLAPGGLIRWEPILEMFPDGLAAFQQNLGLPLILHNRWFAKDNGYRERYSFVDDVEMAFPLDGGVFDDFMGDAASWGAITYEQDWLMPQFWGVSYLRQGVGRAEQWMAWMDDAAQAHGLTMQLCMAGAAHLLDSLDRATPTSVRTSIDYTPSLSKECYWPEFHTVNLLAWALGLWPFKDNFHASETHGEAEALISALSGGMVGAGDQIGLADPELLSRSCRADGLLLKPDRPALPLDAMFLPHTRPFTTFTYSRREGLGQWTYVAAYHLARNHAERSSEDKLWAALSYDGLDVGELFVFPDEVTDWRLDLERDLGLTGEYVAYDWRSGEARRVSGELTLAEFPHLYDFAYLVLAPILPNGVALIGETGKYVTLADRRFADIALDGDRMTVTLAGAPGESVALTIYDANRDSLLNLDPVTLDAQGHSIVEYARP
ncbi:MAG: hypothetical protein C4523_07760 [Myxococcales bacterium]|nr:MAG: hypothetical protein C4523_07760 [Myxococcales bacterium]